MSKLRRAVIDQPMPDAPDYAAVEINVAEIDDPVIRQPPIVLLTDYERDTRMLGRKDYTKEERDHAKTAVAEQVAAYKQLVKAVDSATSDSKVLRP